MTVKGRFFYFMKFLKLRVRNTGGREKISRDSDPISGPSRHDVRFGSKADIGARQSDVRFTPKSGHMQRNRQVRFHLESGHLTEIASLSLLGVERDTGADARGND